MVLAVVLIAKDLQALLGLIQECLASPAQFHAFLKCLHAFLKLKLPGLQLFDKLRQTLKGLLEI
jgi:hypothetical protein